MINLAVTGAAGRMGCAIIRAVAAADGVAVTAAVERAGHDAVGADAGALAGVGDLGVAVTDDLAGDFHILLAFTTPAATLAHLNECRRRGRAVVIGTTGIDDAGRKAIAAAAADIPIVLAANTSVGVNLCVALVKTAAAAVGAVTDIEIVEAHHRGKVDAPSGTALALGEAAAAASGRDLADAGVFARHGDTGARKCGDIGFASVRGGDIAGEHSVLFIGDGERVEIVHRATDRRIFADGAVKAAVWLAGQPPGLYGMGDVLGLA